MENTRLIPQGSLKPAGPIHLNIQSDLSFEKQSIYVSEMKSKKNQEKEICLLAYSVKCL